MRHCPLQSPPSRCEPRSLSLQSLQSDEPSPPPRISPAAQAHCPTARPPGIYAIWPASSSTGNLAFTARGTLRSALFPYSSVYDRNSCGGSCGRIMRPQLRPQECGKIFPLRSCGRKANCGRKGVLAAARVFLRPQEAISATIFLVKYSRKGQNFGRKSHLRPQLALAAAICLAAAIAVAAAI